MKSSPTVQLKAEKYQLDLVTTWLDRQLTERETELALEMIRRGERAPYVARCVDMWARADVKKGAH